MKVPDLILHNARIATLDPLIPEVSAVAIAEGRIHGGMIPKLTEGFAALDQGVRSVLIVGKLRAGDLARAVKSPGAVGTLLTA